MPTVSATRRVARGDAHTRGGRGFSLKSGRTGRTDEPSAIHRSGTRLADATFRTVQQRLGDAGVVDLLLLIGYYWSVSHALSALEAEPGVPSTLSK